MKYYIAYGSNINKSQMDFRCPDNKVIGTTFLKGYELVFHKHLTVEPNKDKMCPIVIYQISDSDEITLDSYEGVGSSTYRKEYMNIVFNGKQLKCLIYIMNDLPHRRGVAPSSEYLNTCLDGYKHFGFDAKFLYEAKNCKK